MHGYGLLAHAEGNRPVVGRTAMRRLLLALALALLPAVRAAAQDIIRLPARVANNSTVIQVSADEVVESSDAGSKTYRLNGLVIKQGVVECRAKRGVIRVVGDANQTRLLDVYL